MPNKKSQAAMEFLMTYGWAILVVLVAVSALAYFGVFDSKYVWKLLPKMCQLPTEIHCADFELYYDDSTLPPSNILKLSLRNNKGGAIRVDKIGVANVEQSSVVALSNGQANIFEVFDITPLNGNTEAISAGDAYKIEFNITYTNTATSLSHFSKAIIRGTQVVEYS